MIEGAVAHRAGLTVGDQIFSLNGTPIGTQSDLLNALENTAGISGLSTIGVRRNGQVHTIHLNLSGGKTMFSAPAIGPFQQGTNGGGSGASAVPGSAAASGGGAPAGTANGTAINQGAIGTASSNSETTATAGNSSNIETTASVAAPAPATAGTDPSVGNAAASMAAAIRNLEKFATALRTATASAKGETRTHLMRFQESVGSLQSDLNAPANESAADARLRSDRFQLRIAALRLQIDNAAAAASPADRSTFEALRAQLNRIAATGGSSNGTAAP